jgi:hypothetical protein
MRIPRAYEVNSPSALKNVKSLELPPVFAIAVEAALAPPKVKSIARQNAALGSRRITVGRFCDRRKHDSAKPSKSEPCSDDLKALRRTYWKKQKYEYDCIAARFEAGAER